jgi:diguanylate cyclase (GGDEF)-like protein
MRNLRRSADTTVVTAMTAPPKQPGPTTEACFVIIVGGELGRRIPLNSQDLLLGRAETADVVLDLENVSRSHALVTHRSGNFVLRDLESTNGTYVNDVRVAEHALRDGDRVQIGRAILKFLTGGNVEAQYHAEIYRVMTLDGLTQIHTRRYFEEALVREIARGQRYGHPFALVMFDVDHFKRVNDSYGHLAGDAVLKHVARRVQEKVRANDVVARLGGEEFAVLLPETELVGARTFAEKLRQLIANDTIDACGALLRVTVSLGVAQHLPSMTTPEAFIQVADERLYDAKRSGRNRVMG